MEFEKENIEKEISSIEDAIFVIQNEHAYL